MSDWVKLHTDILGDPKLMRAARKGARGLEYTPWLIAFARQAGDLGRLTIAGEPAEPEDIAAQIPGARAAQVKAGLEALVTLGVLAGDQDGVLRFAQWAARQQKPSDSRESVRERVRHHRQTTDGTGGAVDVTPCNALHGPLDVTPRNALHTPQDVTPRNALPRARSREGEGEGEEETTTAPPPARMRAQEQPEIDAIFQTATARSAVGDFLNSLPQGHLAHRWLREIQGWRDGLNLPRGVAASEADIAAGLTDYLRLPAPDFGSVHVRSFIARAMRDRERNGDAASSKSRQNTAAERTYANALKATEDVAL